MNSFKKRRSFDALSYNSYNSDLLYQNKCVIKVTLGDLRDTYNAVKALSITYSF
jgi:hypothetical protein